MKKKILVFIAFIIAMTSCADQEKIKISYQTNMSVTAQHLFESFTPIMPEDFLMQGTGYGEWSLNLHALIYDHEGRLIKKEVGQYADLTSSLIFNMDLLPGEYSVVSIAEFSGTYMGEDWTFWQISNEENLKDLSITRSSDFFASPFETLGIASKEFKIGEHVENISLDIQPVTGLLQAVFWDDDFSRRGNDGFCFYAPYIEDTRILTTGIKQVVKFNESLTPTYDYVDGAETYTVLSHSPRNLYKQKNDPRVYTYRALLPQEEKDFYWELMCVPGCGQYLFADGKDFQRLGLTENKLDIQSGGQYAMDLVLDMLYLYVQEHDNNVDINERVENVQEFVNKIYIVDILERRYDYYVGKSRTAIEAYLNKENFGDFETRTLYYFGESLLEYMAVDFTDETMTESFRVRLCFYEDLSPAASEAISAALAEMYVPYDDGTVKEYKQFLDAATWDEATIKIVWDNYSKFLYFEAI